MKLHELSPVRAQRRAQEESAEVTAQAGERQPAKDTRARRHVQAAAFVPALKAVRCRCSVVSPREVSTTSLQKT